jgi:hypothetical protein
MRWVESRWRRLNGSPKGLGSRRVAIGLIFAVASVELDAEE